VTEALQGAAAVHPCHAHVASCRAQSPPASSRHTCLSPHTPWLLLLPLLPRPSPTRCCAHAARCCQGWGRSRCPACARCACSSNDHAAGQDPCSPATRGKAAASGRRRRCSTRAGAPHCSQRGRPARREQGGVCGSQHADGRQRAAVRQLGRKQCARRVCAAVASELLEERGIGAAPGQTPPTAAQLRRAQASALAFHCLVQNKKTSLGQAVGRRLRRRGRRRGSMERLVHMAGSG